MKTHIHIAILGLALVCASAHAAPFGFGPGRAVVAPTVVHGIADDEGNAISYTAPPISDPLEGINRGIYGFNNLLSYLHTPLDVVNYALQGNGEMAGNAMGRLLVNTFGFGVFDIASEAGISRKQTGFGETFGVWGAPQGPYVVLPIFGGRSLRGTIGTVGDAQLGVVGQLKTDEQTTARVLDALDTRSRLLGTENMVSQASLDEYAFVRDALMQRESNRVQELKE